MRILLTNDDGIYAGGIAAIYKELKKLGEVTVVAPLTEQSAVGHAITMATPLRIKEVEVDRNFSGYAVSGTPADCVKIAVRSLLKKRPDIVVSGINLGPNTGFSVLYSGTVSGATEGTILGLPSLAVSLGAFFDPDFSLAAGFGAKMARIIIKKGLPQGTFLNVNVPGCKKSEIRGVAVTTQGTTPIIETFDKRVDPRKRTYYWLTGEVIDLEGDETSDIVAVKNNYISVTPIKYDLTDRDFIKNVNDWKISV